MRSSVIVYIVTLLSTSYASAPELCSVSFTVVNFWGQAHKYAVRHFRSAAQIDLASRFNSLAAKDIPQGSYDYELTPAPGDTAKDTFTGSVSVYRKQVHVTRLISGPDSVGDRVEVGVKGSLWPLPDVRGPVWVVVENAYGQNRQESMVDVNGAFEFDYIWGNTIVIVCAGSDVIMATPLIVERNQVLRAMRIDLKARRVEPTFW